MEYDLTCECSGKKFNGEHCKTYITIYDDLEDKSKFEIMITGKSKVAAVFSKKEMRDILDKMEENE